MDVNYTYHGNHFTIYMYIKSSCTFATNKILYVKYISIKLEKNTFKLIYIFSILKYSKCIVKIIMITNEIFYQVFM